MFCGPGAFPRWFQSQAVSHYPLRQTCPPCKTPKAWSLRTETGRKAHSLPVFSGRTLSRPLTDIGRTANMVLMRMLHKSPQNCNSFTTFLVLVQRPLFDVVLTYFNSGSIERRQFTHIWYVDKTSTSSRSHQISPDNCAETLAPTSSAFSFCTLLCRTF
ncbi:hypothetical protein SCLCIDRAFT_303407 [Scleroderma citrinum Foug A]|uniref:Uncharacterized protein n=1 Tax=Scleroderma citrinum Foug A TaxID=1036808 RepID=A0A0C3DG26_9AGAM|nr:hypothetical protein SCLCIDRAFT_303407 [Scleroderma citrinum Foug A]